MVAHCICKLSINKVYINVHEQNLISILEDFIYLRLLIFAIGCSQWQKQMLKSRESIKRGGSWRAINSLKRTGKDKKSIIQKRHNLLKTAKTAKISGWGRVRKSSKRLKTATWHREWKLQFINSQNKNNEVDESCWN